MLVPPKRSIHQGAVFARVPIMWLPPPLWVMRPKYRPFPDMSPCLASDATDVFVGDEGEEMVIASAKARPVVVLSPYRELRLRQIRVVPLYSYRQNSSLSRIRPAIEAGEQAGAYHLVGDTRFGIHDGVLRLDQAQSVHADFLVKQVATLTDAALAGLIGQLASYVRTLDRRPAA